MAMEEGKAETNGEAKQDVGRGAKVAARITAALISLRTPKNTAEKKGIGITNTTQECNDDLGEERRGPTTFPTAGVKFS